VAGSRPASRTEGRRVGHLWLLPSALLVVEVLALQARFSAAPFADVDARWASIILALRELPRIALASLTALVLLGWSSLAEELARLRTDPHASRARPAWIALQLGAFALLWGSAAVLFDREPASDPPSSLLLGVWPFLALICLGLAVRATAPLGTWLALLKRRWSLLLSALTVGFLAWAAGTWSQGGLREVLRLPTLRVAYAMLFPFVDGAFIAPEAFQFGTKHFGVDLAPGCSGLDGIGLVGTFTAAWLVWQRRELRFPLALLLLPIGIAASWILNAARLAALVLIGEHASSRAAVAGFHSVAGLVFFCATAIGVVALGSSNVFQRSAVRVRAKWLDATAAYLLPLVLWVGIGLLAAAFPVQPAMRLGLRCLAVAALLVAAWPQLRELVQAPTSLGIAVSLLCVGVALCLPRSVQEGVMVQRDPQDMPHGLLAIVAALLVAPIVEELAFRGYLMRRFASIHFERLDARRAGWLGILVSSVLFGVLHPAWHAGIAFGLLYALAFWVRGRMADAVLAHACSNLALLWVLRQT